MADLQRWDTFKISFLSQIVFFGAFKFGNLARVEAAESGIARATLKAAKNPMPFLKQFDFFHVALVLAWICLYLAGPG